MSDLDVMERLRQARPGDIPAEDLSPHSPSAQALAERILASPREVGVAAEVLDLAPRSSRSRTRFLLVAAALAVVAAAGAVAVGTRPNEDGRDAISAPAIQVPAITTARMSVHNKTSYESSSMGMQQETIYEIAGEDISMTVSNDGIPTSRQLLVGGESFAQTLHPSSSEPGRWDRLDDPEESSLTRFALWPARIHEGLATVSDVVPVAEEEVRGVPTHHVRAAHPDQIVPETIGLDLADFTTIDSLDIWLDDDGLVRRVSYTLHGRFGDDPLSDLSSSETSVNDGFNVEATIEIYDIGADITFEPPNIP